MDRATLRLRTVGIRRFLPTGRVLEELDFSARHRLLTTILALHIPALIVVGLVTDHGVLATLAGPAVIAALVGLAVLPGDRRRRALSTSFGLLTCSALLVHLTHGSAEAHFHYFVAVALIALYQDWTVYALAFVFVVVEQIVVSNLDRADSYEQTGNTWVLAGVLAGFIAALCCAQLTFWHFLEQSRLREEHYRRKLYAGQQSMVAQMQATEQLRADLLGTVSHEFRTPLTAIQVSALTLRRRRNRLSPAQVDDILDALIGHGQRLSRLLENMLTAAGVVTADQNAVCDARVVADDAVADLSVESRSRVSVEMPATLLVRMERRALQQVLANVLDNALTHSWPGTPVTLTGDQIGADVVLHCRNSGPDLDEETIQRLFEPFAQADGSATREREGAGMGLPVARRLVEAHKGRLWMRSKDSEVVVEITLRATGERVVELPATSSSTASPPAASSSSSASSSAASPAAASATPSATPSTISLDAEPPTSVSLDAEPPTSASA
jgi:signal transduction histidine kinase